MTLAKNLGLLCALFFSTTSLTLANISALGRIMPSSGVVDIWGPSGLKIDSIHAQQGQVVEKGDLLATLSNQTQVQAEVKLAELNLLRFQHAYSLEVELQTAIITSLNADFEIASKRLKESQKNKDIISPQIIQEREQTVSTTKNAITKALAAKKKALTLLELDQKIAEENLKSAQALLPTAEIRAPITGTVLIILKTEGSTLGRGEFIKLANTAQMNISAEVYESDISKVQIGQKVRVESVALSEPLTGEVTQKGHMLFSRSVDSLDARSLTNSRVIEVTIELENSQAAQNLSYLQVDVFID